MQHLGYPELDGVLPGRCASDGSITRTQLPCGSYLCPACVRMYREHGWLDASFEYTDVFFVDHPHLWWLRIRRRDGERVVIDLGRLVAEFRVLLASGASLEEALRRFKSEAQVGEFCLVPTVVSAVGIDIREARRLVVQAVGNWSSESTSNGRTNPEVAPL